MCSTALLKVETAAKSTRDHPSECLWCLWLAETWKCNQCIAYAYDNPTVKPGFVSFADLQAEAAAHKTRSTPVNESLCDPIAHHSNRTTVRFHHHGHTQHTRPVSAARSRQVVQTPSHPAAPHLTAIAAASKAEHWWT